MAAPPDLQEPLCTQESVLFLPIVDLSWRSASPSGGETHTQTGGTPDIEHAATTVASVETSVEGRWQGLYSEEG